MSKWDNLRNDLAKARLITNGNNAVRMNEMKSRDTCTNIDELLKTNVALK
jgi:hypothetical protein